MRDFDGIHPIAEDAVANNGFAWSGGIIRRINANGEHCFGSIPHGQLTMQLGAGSVLFFARYGSCLEVASVAKNFRQHLRSLSLHICLAVGQQLRARGESDGGMTGDNPAYLKAGR